MFNILRAAYSQKHTCFLSFIVLLLLAGTSSAQWLPCGPDGGEVRSLASDPQNSDRIYLGTSSGTIFLSMDAGRTWSRLSHLGRSDDYVIDHIAIDPHDPRNLYAAAWSLSKHYGGEFFRSSDGGKTWLTEPSLHGKSIRSMGIANSQPGLLVVGTLDGVFRSKDWGRHWQNISLGQKRIRNVASIAIDPQRADVIYAGTWHLPWKTTDGGTTWHRLDHGMIDDSDVFSIMIDQSNPQIVFAGACSGIYRSENGGERFERIQGIPFSARRTHILRQDPNRPSVVFAGTTEGLWVTQNSGLDWVRATSPDTVVNDVLAGSNGRVLLATDRQGVLAGESRQLTFSPSNSGFAHRFVSSILSDEQNPNDIYLGVVNDREQGGVFVSSDGGRSWSESNAGLDGRDVFVLKQSTDGSIVAGTDRGLFLHDPNAGMWKQLAIGEQHLTIGTVNDLEITSNHWIAATATGLYVSSDNGEHWSRSSVLSRLHISSIRAHGNLIALVSARGLVVSLDGGVTWSKSRKLPPRMEGLTSLIITVTNDILVSSHEGVFRTRDLGATWQRIQHGLPQSDVTGLFYDENQNRLVAIPASGKSIFESKDAGASWHRRPDPGVSLRRLGFVQGHILAASKFDGMLLESPGDLQRSRTRFSPN
jgi:photosystem II stability/assembly factor-like uncharacterized protein